MAMSDLRIMGLAFAGLAISVLTGCSGALSPADGSRTADSDIVDLGANALGERCRLREDKHVARAAGERHYTIQCGDWSTPSARLVQVAEDAETGPGSSLWQREVTSRLLCGAEEDALVLGDRPARLHRCRLRRGGWPMLALIVGLPDQALLMQTIPSGLGVAEAALAHIAGLEAGAVGDAGPRGTRSRSIELLELALRDQLFSAGDIRAYEELLDVAQYYNSVGNFIASERFYRDALSILRKVVPPDDPVLADPLTRLALALSNQGKVTEAEALFKTLDGLSAGALDPLTVPRLRIARASHEVNRNRCRAALRELQAGQARLIEIANSASGSEVQILAGGADAAAVELALSGALESAIMLCLNDLDAADKAADRAIAILTDTPQAPRDWRPVFLSLRAEILRRRRSLDSGEDDLERALRDRRVLYDRSRLEGLDYLYLGGLNREAGRRDDALENFRRGVSVLRETNEGVTLDQVLPFLRLLNEEAGRDPARAQTLHAEMFAAGQIVRNSLTARTIAATSARLAAGDQAVSTVIRDLQEARRRIGDLNRAIDAAQARTDAGGRVIEIAAMIEDRDAARQEASALEEEVQAAAPAYNQLVSRPQDLVSAQAALAADEAILQVLIGETSSLAFFVTRDTVEPHFIGFGSGEAAFAVAKLRAGLTIGTGQRLGAFDLKLAHGLYRAILGPFEQRLATVRHLITVPTGPLASLPFAILVTQRPQGRGVRADTYRKTAWLGTAHAISVAPSVRSLVDLRTLPQAPKRSRTLIGFGDFQGPQNAPAVPITPLCESRVQWMARNAPPLPETRAELEAIARGLPDGQTDLRLGEAFTEAAVQGAALEDYRIVYFATHGLMPADVGCRTEPALVTSGFRQDTPDRDGLLTSSDVLGLRMNADLVVLSACNTGGGDGSGGEGLSGLARSFFYAGARGMLVSHWYVESAATQRLMTDVFARLADNPALGSAEALRQAQDALFLQERGSAIEAHPAFWAAFTVVGDGARPVRVR